jgi:hypothetical protein
MVVRNKAVKCLISRTYFWGILCLYCKMNSLLLTCFLQFHDCLRRKFVIPLEMHEIITKVISTRKGLIEFRFEPLQVGNHTLFATYCHYDGSQYCFHLSAENETTEFRIMDKQNCPYDIHGLELLLSDAIYQFHL